MASLLLPTLLAAAFTGGGESVLTPRVLFDFGPGDLTEWTTVHDTVMGGRSSGRLERTEAGTLVFRGKLSLENNGGFTSFRSGRLDLDLAGSAGLEVRLKGDGRSYIWSCDMRGVPVFGGGYWQEFTTVAGEWTTVRLPWSGFEPYSFGRKLEGQPTMDPERLAATGVYLYDKQEGPFALEIDAISAYWPGDPAPTGAAPPADPVVALLGDVVERGSALFNRGNTAACAEAYRAALRSLLLFGQLDADAALRAQVARALEQASGQASRDAAWTLRGAIDAVFVARS